MGRGAWDVGGGHCGDRGVGGGGLKVCTRGCRLRKTCRLVRCTPPSTPPPPSAAVVATPPPPASRPPGAGGYSHRIYARRAQHVLAVRRPSASSSIVGDSAAASYSATPPPFSWNPPSLSTAEWFIHGVRPARLRADGRPGGRDHARCVAVDGDRRRPGDAVDEAQPGGGLLQPDAAPRHGLLGPGPGGDDRLPAPRRAQARPRRDGRLRRLHHPGERHPLPVGIQGDDVGETIAFADISAAGGPADQWDALPTPAKVQILGGDRLPRVVRARTRTRSRQTARRTTCAAASRATTRRSRATRAARPAPGAARPLRPVRLHQEADGRAQGEGAPRRDQQRPPRDDRHHGPLSASKGLIVPGLDAALRRQRRPPTPTSPTCSTTSSRSSRAGRRAPRHVKCRDECECTVGCALR